MYRETCLLDFCTYVCYTCSFQHSLLKVHMSWHAVLSRRRRFSDFTSNFNVRLLTNQIAWCTFSITILQCLCLLDFYAILIQIHDWCFLFFLVSPSILVSFCLLLISFPDCCYYCLRRMSNFPLFFGGHGRYLSSGNLRDANQLMDELKKQVEEKQLDLPQSDLIQFVTFLLQTWVVYRFYFP